MNKSTTKAFAKKRTQQQNLQTLLKESRVALMRLQAKKPANVYTVRWQNFDPDMKLDVTLGTLRAIPTTKANARGIKLTPKRANLSKGRARSTK